MSALIRTEIRRTRRIVVKVGSAILAADGRLADEAFAAIARQISELADAGREVVLVTSGAVAMGSRELGWKLPNRSIPQKQAAAAVGQIGLTGLYKREFARFGRQVGQILVTRTGLEDHERFLNARHTLLTLLRSGVIPIVNENDTVATEEIRFGDNDNLSATVVNLVAADLLIILTDVDGLYVEAPRANAPTPALFGEIDSITPEVRSAAKGSASGVGRGGMTTKVEAAQAASRCGAATIICNGRSDSAIVRAANGEAIGTLFRSGDKLASRKHWLAFTTRTLGTVKVDAGAARAIEEGGKSLLSIGIESVQGSFGIGDAIGCVAPSGRLIARGLTSYGSEDLTRIAGIETNRIEQVLGYSNGDEVIHRDDLVLLKDDSSQ